MYYIVKTPVFEVSIIIEIFITMRETIDFGLFSCSKCTLTFDFVKIINVKFIELFFFFF